MILVRRPGDAPTLFRFVQAPFDSAPTGNEEENKTVKGSQLAFVQCRKQLRSDLELPVVLNVSHGHRAAAEESRGAGLKPQHHHQSSHELDNTAEPELRPYWWLKLRKYSEGELGPVEREHEARRNSQQGVSVAFILSNPFHECTLLSRLSANEPVEKGPWTSKNRVSGVFIRLIHSFSLSRDSIKPSKNSGESFSKYVPLSRSSISCS